MKVSRKTYYGLRALTALASSGISQSAHILAKNENIPEDYLEKILQSLNRNHFVISEKGARGGYSLARTPETITVWEIIESLDGGFTPIHNKIFSGTLSPCPILTHCKTKNVWNQLESAIKNTLSKITLADLALGENKKSTRTSSQENPSAFVANLKIGRET